MILKKKLYWTHLRHCSTFSEKYFHIHVTFHENHKKNFSHQKFGAMLYTSTCTCMLHVFHLVSIHLLNQPLQRGHPGRSQMAVLEEDPPPSVHGLPHHGFSARTLTLPQGDSRELLVELHLVKREGKHSSNFYFNSALGNQMLIACVLAMIVIHTVKPPLSKTSIIRMGIPPTFSLN